MGRELKKILFIDDDKDIHLIVQISLEMIQGIDLKLALSGEEGIKCVMDFNPDLILLDVMMPNMDGIGTLKALKLLPKLAETPVVFVTARAQEDEVEEYLKAGAFDVIVKPFDPVKLPEIVQKIWINYCNKT